MSARLCSSLNVEKIDDDLRVVAFSRRVDDLSEGDFAADGRRQNRFSDDFAFRADDVAFDRCAGERHSGRIVEHERSSDDAARTAQMPFVIGKRRSQNGAARSAVEFTYNRGRIFNWNASVKNAETHLSGFAGLPRHIVSNRCDTLSRIDPLS